MVSLTFVGDNDGLFEGKFEGDLVGEAEIIGDAVGGVDSSDDGFNCTASIQTFPEKDAIHRKGKICETLQFTTKNYAAASHGRITHHLFLQFDSTNR